MPWRASVVLGLLLILTASSAAWAQAPTDQPSTVEQAADAPQRRADVPREPAVADGAFGILDEPSFITKGVTLFDRRASRSREPKDGFYLEMGNMITGAGFISAGPGVRKHVLGDNAILSASTAMSIHLYGMAQGAIEFPHLAGDHIRFGAQTIFRDARQVNYYGLGNDSLLSHRSGYRLQTNDATMFAGLSARALRVESRAGWLQPVSVGSMEREAVYPDTVTLFSESGAPGIISQPSFLHGDLSIGIDTRDSLGHPTVGGRYRVTGAIFQDQTTGRHSFRRYEADAVQYVPLGSPNWILALHAVAALSDTNAGQTVPFHMMPNLGGRNQRGFADYRFHDRNMQAYSVESRWRLFSHVDTAVFVDAGSVAPTISGLKFSDLKPAYGFGIRLHNNRVTIARFDVGHSVEGWHVFFRMNEPFRRSSQSTGSRVAAPYVP